MRQNFEIADDPCLRGDTTLSGAEWRNAGLPCQIKSKLDVGGGETVPVAIIVPPDLRLRPSSRAGFTIATPVRDVPMVEFGDANWQNDWGGSLSYVAFSNQLVMFQTARGCISLELAS